MQIQTSLLTLGDNRVEALISYALVDGWHYTFVAAVEEYLAGRGNEVIKLRRPVASEFYHKIRLGSPNSSGTELYSTMSTMAGGEWDERWVNGKLDLDFPPMDMLDDDDTRPTQYIVTDAEERIFEEIKAGLKPRFAWPADLCQFVFDKFDKSQLRPLRNNEIKVWSDCGFEIDIWIWALIPTFARSSLLEPNSSQAQGLPSTALNLDGIQDKSRIGLRGLAPMEKYRRIQLDAELLAGKFLARLGGKVHVVEGHSLNIRIPIVEFLGRIGEFSRARYYDYSERRFSNVEDLREQLIDSL